MKALFIFKFHSYVHCTSCLASMQQYKEREGFALALFIPNPKSYILNPILETAE